MPLRFIKACLIALSMAAFGCAPPSLMQATSMNGQEHVGTTGFFNSEGSAYTIGGDSRLLLADASAEIAAQQPKSEPPSPIRKKDIATEVKAVRFARYNTENKIDRFGTSGFKVEIEVLSGELLVFSGKFSTLETTPKQLTVARARDQKSEKRRHAIDIEFEDDRANNYSTGRISLLSFGNTSKAEIYVRSYAAGLESFPPETDTLNAVNKRILRLIDERGLAWVTNSVVQGGRSFYQVHVFSVIEQSTTAPDKVDLAAHRSRLFSFAGEALRTGDYSDRRAQKLENGLLKIQNAELIGDAETTDERTFSVVLKGDSDQTLDFAIKIQKASTSEKTEIQTLPQHYQLIGLTDQSFLKANYTDTRLLRTKKMIDDYEKNYSLPGVQNWIRKYTTPPAKGGRNYPAELLNALKNSGQFRTVIETIFQSYDVAPQASLVTFFESAFFTNDGFPLQTNPKSTASGPAQLLYGTALGFGLKVVNNPIGVLPPASDQRLYFIPAACACAAHHEKSLDSVAKVDASLAFSAYYMGDAGAAGQIHQALTGQRPTKKDPFSTVLRYRIHYHDVAKQKMLPLEVIDYTNHALALYFVTGNPNRFNLEFDFTRSPALPKNKMLPKNPVTIDRCKSAIASLMGRGIIN